MQVLFTPIQLKKKYRSVIAIIDYNPLWEQMKAKGITTYVLINTYEINPRTISNLKHNKSITMHTLEKLCTILDCTPDKIVSFTKD